MSQTQPRALIVEDSPTQALALRAKLVRFGFEAVIATNGVEALAAIAKQAPQLVLTDLQMPEMDGLDLVKHIKRNHPGLPIVLLTAHGSEEIAVEALRAGAASYVPKKNLDRDLPRTLENVLALARTTKTSQHVGGCLMETRSTFELENDPGLFTPLVGRLQDNLRRLRLFDETVLMRVSIALREALVNAMEHGNLELSSRMRRDDEAAYDRLLAERRRQEPYASRRLYLTAHEHRDGVEYQLRDEGPGFDVSSVPDPREPANLDQITGRGLLLIQSFMDRVEFNPAGNGLTMVKRRPEAAAASSCANGSATLAC